MCKTNCTYSVHPDDIHLPGVFVDRVVVCASSDECVTRLSQQWLEQQTQQQQQQIQGTKDYLQYEKRLAIARRAAQECIPYSYINLGFIFL